MPTIIMPECKEQERVNKNNSATLSYDTCRLNQDPVENCFSVVRRTTPSGHPTSACAVDKVRIYMLNRNVKVNLWTIQLLKIFV